MSELKVLIVDDKIEDRAALHRLLATLELNIGMAEECGAGAEAQSLVHELNPDIVFVAFDEPVARPLKTIESLAMEGKGIIIAVSPLTDRDYLRKAMRAGAKEYLLKPLKAKEVSRAVQEVLEEERRKSTSKLLSDSGYYRRGSTD